MERELIENENQNQLKQSDKFEIQNENELLPEKSEAKVNPRKIIRINQKVFYDNPIKDIQEKALREKIKLSPEEAKQFDIALSGTSATLVIQTAKKCYIAWVGDSQAVLGRKDRKAAAVKLTEPEHTPIDQNEKIRIYNHRGEVRTLTHDKKTRIYVRARMYPGLSTSRSLGDLLAHHIGVTSEPNIKIMDI